MPHDQLDVRTGAWMCTYTGLRFYPLDPRPADICIEDIAHALGNVCRFGGHCSTFYSVAQHSVLVSRVIEKRHGGRADMALWGLLHDASEAYLGDVVWPLKQSREMGGYKSVEATVMLAIAERFGLSMPEPPEVKAADLVLLSTEKRDLMSGRDGRDGNSKVELAAAAHAGRVPWHTDVTPLLNRIIPWPPDDAAAIFYDRFETLLRSRDGG